MFLFSSVLLHTLCVVFPPKLQGVLPEGLSWVALRLGSLLVSSSCCFELGT